MKLPKEENLNTATIALPNLVYVLVGHRDDFDKLALKEQDYRNEKPRRELLVKVLEADGVTVVFQHWLADERG